jgi:hypothetical protein
MAGRRQRSVKVKDDNTPFVIYHPFPCYKLPPVGVDIPSEGLVTTSIDIGIKNFAIRIERRYNNGLIAPIFFDKVDFTKFGVDTSDCAGTAVVDPRVLAAATAFLTQVMPMISESRLIGIERQMAINTKSTRMFQHVLTMLLVYVPTFKYPDCTIFDIWAHLKGRMLGAPKGMNSAALKAWTIDKVIELLEWRGDSWSLGVVRHHRGTSKTKADDLCDTIAQMEAIFIHLKGVTTQQPIVLNLQLPVQPTYQVPTTQQYVPTLTGQMSYPTLTSQCDVGQMMNLQLPIRML